MVGDHAARRRRRALLTMVLVVTAVAGGGIAIAAWVAHQRDVEYGAELERDFLRVTTRLQRTVDRMSAHLSGAQGIVDGDTVSTRRFEAFAAGIRSEDPVIIAALELVVDADERADFEDRAGFEIWTDPTTAGELAPSGRHYPIVAIHPDDEQARTILGLDISRDPTRRRAAALARDTGDSVPTPPVALPYSAEPAIIVVHPLYAAGAPASTPEERRDALVGFVSTSYAMSALLAEATETTVLFEQEMVLDAADAESTPLARGWRQRAFEVGPDTWVLRARPKGPPTPWASLAIVAVSLVVAGLLAELIRRAWRYDVDLARSNDDLRNEQRRTAGLQSLTATLASAATVPDVVQAALRQGLPLLGAGAGRVEVVSEAGDMIELATSGELDTPGSTSLVRDLADEGERLGRLTASLTAGADLRAADQMLSAVATLTGHALARARRYDTEHQMVRALQSMLLPVLPSRWGPIELAATYRPVLTSSGVGGDWYDVLDTDRGPAVVIGDVVGKGIRAAGVMGQLRIATRTMADRHDPSAVLGSLDELANELTDAWMTSVVYVVVDVGDRRITLGVAGHPPPLLLQPGRRPQWLDECVGPPLGVERGRRVTASVVYDGPARLVLYTDGLVERRDQPIDVGLARLRDAAYGLLDVEGDEFLDRLVAEMAPEAEQQDDIAVLCADLGR